MNAFDILGSLLGGGGGRASGGSGGGTAGGGGRASSGGLGGSIIDELLKGAAGGGAAKQSPPSSRGSAAPSNRPMDVDEEARSLEELLGVATGKSQQPSRTGHEPSAYRPAPSSPNLQPSRQTSSRPSAPQFPPAQPVQPAKPSMTSDDEAIVLIRALINGAKADGRIDANEQQTILGQVPNDQATISFLKQEFAQPLDVREFAWSVPLGMEVKAYTMSLAGMQLDVQPEADYLVQLAHGLRLSPDVCRQIHVRYGAPDIF